MYINHSGTVKNQSAILSVENRGLKFGDSLFESFRVIDRQIVFWEDHYFRLMAGMRIMRMDIPLSFTMDFFSAQVAELLSRETLTHARVRLTIFRKDGGRYLPTNNKVDYLITCEPLEETIYTLLEIPYFVDIFRDYKKNKSLLSNIKCNNKLEHIIAAIYAKENDLDDVILVNTDNHIAETVNANIFIVQGNIVRTPDSNQGCLKGIIRKKLIALLNASETYVLEETSIEAFELMKADELFVANTAIGIRSVTQFRKKNYSQRTVAQMLTKELNQLATNSSLDRREN